MAIRIPASLDDSMLKALQRAITSLRPDQKFIPLDNLGAEMPSRHYSVSQNRKTKDDSLLTAFNSPTPMLDVDLPLAGDVHGIREMRDEQPEVFKAAQGLGMFPELGDALDRVDRYERDSGRTFLKKLTPGGLHFEEMSNPITSRDWWRKTLQLRPSAASHFEKLPEDIQQMVDPSYVRMSEMKQTYPRRISMKPSRTNDFVEAPLFPLEPGRAGVDPERLQADDIQTALIELINGGQRGDPRETMAWAASKLDPKRAALIRALHKLGIGAGAGAAWMAQDSKTHPEEEKRGALDA